MTMRFFKTILPFALTLLVGVSLASLLKHRHHSMHHARAALAYGGVYEDGRVFVSPAPNTYALEQVTRKAVILAKPEPLYTDEARRHGTAGMVRLRVLLNAAGEVTRIEPLTYLPDGLTESAVEAARRIEFIPAQQDGQPVSQAVTIDYRFDIK
jgi:TonB family protein